MSEGHTPGPWTLSGDVDVDAGDLAIATVHYMTGEEFRTVGPVPSDDQCKANARLIAAAPELLSAAKKLMDSINQYDPEQRGCSTVAYSEMWTAIAKAEGRE